MTTPSTPALSVVVTTDSLPPIRNLLARYRAQGDPARLELVVVAVAGARLQRDSPALASFPRVRIVEAADTIDVARAELAGLRAATAEYVVFAEASSRPLPGFVDAVIAASRSGEWAVIGPAMVSANPGSATSWAGMWINYGPFAGTHGRGPAVRVPGHDSAYRRSALLSLGADLEPLMASLTALQAELRARGHEVFREPDARCEVLNISRPGWYLVDQFGKGRIFASMRGGSWSRARRLLYAAGSLAIPAIRLVHTLAALRACGRVGELLHVRRLPLVIGGLVCGAAGEMAGYALGGAAVPVFYERNLYRPRYLRLQDRRREEDEST